MHSKTSISGFNKKGKLYKYYKQVLLACMMKEKKAWQRVDG